MVRPHSVIYAARDQGGLSRKGYVLFTLIIANSRAYSENRVKAYIAKNFVVP